MMGRSRERGPQGRAKRSQTASIYPATAFAHARKPKCGYWRCPTLELFFVALLLYLIPAAFGLGSFPEHRRHLGFWVNCNFRSRHLRHAAMKDKTVAILESRMRDQIAGLVRKYGGTPFLAPALAEAPDVDPAHIEEL